MANLMGDIILVFIAAGLGVLIGYNLRNESAQRKENMKFEEVRSEEHTSELQSH